MDTFSARITCSNVYKKYIFFYYLKGVKEITKSKHYKKRSPTVGLKIPCICYFNINQAEARFNGNS